MRKTSAQFQIGKNGVTPGVIESLSLMLKSHRQIRVAALPSSGRDRKNIEDMALEIQSELPVKCNFKIIGFKIILTKSQIKK